MKRIQRLINLSRLLLVFLCNGAFAFSNMAYVEVNSNALKNVACFQLSASQTPFFDMASIFAANINGESPNEASIYFNPQVSRLLNQSDDVSRLHAKGIKVLLTLLGNHQNAGWSCFTDENAAKRFAHQIALTLEKYHLDGVDIDDEYSRCQGNDYSLIMLTKAIKEEPLFRGKLLTKALWADARFFKANYQGHHLADYLDFGFEMSYGYGGPLSRLSSYLSYGMRKDALMLGVSTHGSRSGAERDTKETMTQGFGGIMVYDITRESRAYLSALSEAEYGQSLEVPSNCLMASKMMDNRHA